MDKKIEQRVCLKFCVSNGITATESLKMLQKCFGESILSRTQIFEWHKAFSKGRDSTHCGSCFGYEAHRRQTRTERSEFSSLIVTEFLAKRGTKVIAQTPFSPDLAL